MGPNCERLISDGPQNPPYNLSRRMTDSGAPGGSFTDISVVANDSFLAVGMTHSAWLISASLFILISLACLLLSLLHHRCRTDYDFESLAAIETATLTRHGQTNKIMGIDHPDASLPVARTDFSMGIRRRSRLNRRGNRQEVQDEASIGNRLAGKETFPDMIRRYLRDPPELGTIEELQYFPYKLNTG